MSYHSLFEGVCFVQSYSTHTHGMHMALEIYLKKTGKMKHAYNKDKTRSIILKRQPECDVSWI